MELTVGSARISGQSVHVPGAKRTVIFLHAGVADSRMFSSQVAALSDRYSVASFDRRGFGRTVTANEPFSHVNDLFSLARSMDAESKVLVGCSQGARVALDYTLQFPDSVNALVLISATYSGADPAHLDEGESELVNQIDTAEQSGDLDEVNRLEAHLWLDGPRCEEGRVSGSVRELFLDMNGGALRAPNFTQRREPPSAATRLSEIRCPVLLVEGDQDVSFIRARHDRLETSIGDCRRMVVAGAAHLLSLEKPEAFNTLLADFLDTLD